MQKQILLSLLLLSLSYFPAEAHACTCRRESLESIYKKSTQVFVAKVVEVREIQLQSKDQDTVVYEAVLKPKRMIKGRRPGKITIKYEILRNPTFVDGVETLTVGGCYMQYSIGGEYVVFTNPGESLDWQDWCSSRIGDRSRIDMDYLESLGK
jgi:hypothetical protein